MTAVTVSPAPLRLVRALARALLATAILLPLLAWGLDRSLGRDVLLIAPYDAAVVALNRSLWTPGEPIAELYGSPLSAPVRVLVADYRSLLHPEEDPALVLLPTGAGSGRPFQVKTLWLLTRLAALALAACGAGALAAQRLVARRAAAAARG